MRQWLENWRALCTNPFRYRIKAGHLEGSGTNWRVGLLLLSAPTLISIWAVGTRDEIVTELAVILSVVFVPWALAFLCRSETLAINPERILYSRSWGFGSKKIVAPRNSARKVRLVTRRYEYESHFTIFTVELVFHGDGLPSFVKLAEAFDEEKARRIAERVKLALSLPLEELEVRT